MSFLIKYTTRQETNINFLNKEKGSSFIDNIIDNDLSTGSIKME